MRGFAGFFWPEIHTAFCNYLCDRILGLRAWRRPDTENGRIVIIVLRYFKVCIAPGGGAAVGGSLRSSLSGSRPTSHSQGHGRPCLPRPHLRPRFHETTIPFFSLPILGVRTSVRTFMRLGWSENDYGYSVVIGNFV